LSQGHAAADGPSPRNADHVRTESPRDVTSQVCRNCRSVDATLAGSSGMSIADPLAHRVLSPNPNDAKTPANRQRRVNSASVREIWQRPQATAMGFNDRAADRQPVPADSSVLVDGRRHRGRAPRQPIERPAGARAPCPWAWARSAPSGCKSPHDTRDLLAHARLRFGCAPSVSFFVQTHFNARATLIARKISRHPDPRLLRRTQCAPRRTSAD
jgi:hypothetical protein